MDAMKKGIPCAVMRGGTSKGAYFLLSDLPADEGERNRLLLSIMGGDRRQINGLGGGDMLSAKVAVVAPSAEEGVDAEYRFAQIVPGENRVDTSPTCGNILAGVGAFAIESGLVAAEDGVTQVVVRDINTGAKVEQIVRTPGRRVCYEGDCEIAGAPGAASPVELFYLEFAGAKTGRLFPSGAFQDDIDGVAATCIDAAMPMVIVAAKDLGCSGYESREELQNDGLLVRLESLRLQAAKKMGLGDARGKVIPKFAMVAPPQKDGAIAARYFTPVSAHAAFAVSGGIALASAVLQDGTVARQFARPPAADESGCHAIDIEHPSGMMRVTVAAKKDGDGVWQPRKAGIVRTARLIMRGEVFPA